MWKYLLWILICAASVLCTNKIEAGTGQKFDAEMKVSEWNVLQEVGECSVISTKTDSNKLVLTVDYSSWNDLNLLVCRVNEALIADVCSPKGSNLPKILKFIDTSIRVLSLKNEELPQDDNRVLYAHSIFKESPCNYYVYSLRRILI